jgi:hypothetical protein
MHFPNSSLKAQKTNEEAGSTGALLTSDFSGSQLAQGTTIVTEGFRGFASLSRQMLG